MRENFTRWTCNVCRKVEETTNAEQPEGWAGYGFTDYGKPPAAELTDLGHLCQECKRAVSRTMEGS